MKDIDKNREIVLATAPLPYKDNRSSSLGLGLLSASLKKEGYEKVFTIDASFEGMDINQLIGEIREKVSDLSFFGLSVLPSSMQASKELLIAMREEFGDDVEICLGGYLPTSLGDKTFEVFTDSHPDFAVMGRGEKAILDILKYGESKALPNVISRLDSGELLNGGRAHVDYSRSPWPERSPETLWGNTAQVYRLVGCPGNCNFCCIHDYANDFHEQPKQRSAADFADEIKFLVEEHGIDCFDILDEDALGKNPEEWWDILEEFKKRGLKGKIKYWMLSRVATVGENEELIKAMAEYGLTSCYCGLESFSDQQLQRYNKTYGLTGEQFYFGIVKSKDILERHGVIPKYGFVPIDVETTFEDYSLNIELLKMHGFLYYVSELTKRLAIYGGSKMERIYRKKGYLLDIDKSGSDKDWITSRYNYTIIDPRVQRLSDAFDIWTKGIVQASIPVKKAMRKRFEDPHFAESDRTWELFKKLRDEEYAMVMNVMGMIEEGVHSESVADQVRQHVGLYHAIAEG